MSNFNNNPNNNSMDLFKNSINVDNFWSNPMFNNFNNFNNINMPQNNMNSFLWGFQNNPMNNLQQSFINLGGNFCPMPNINNNINNINLVNMNVNNCNNQFNNFNNFNNNLSNSFNNFNNFNNNNFNASFNNNNIDNNPLRKFNSAEITQKMNINNFDSEIQINFRFINSQSFKINAKQNEKLIDVINKFKNNECPKELKEELTACICQGERIKDLNKSLSELNIRNEEPLLFMKDKSEEDKKKEEMKYELTEREIEQVNRFKSKYAEIYFNQNSNNDNANNQEEIPTFISFLKKEDRKGGCGILTKEHKDKLVYCVTNKEWTCRLCEQNYSKEKARYYCSICGYSMCENCHYKKKYFMKKSFPPGIKPSNPSVNIHELYTDYHPHRLVYCRTSRSFMGFSGWICDNCRETFDNRVWSFYCTQCDFDLCCDCCGYH